MGATATINDFYPTLAVAPDSSAVMIWNKASNGQNYVRTRSPGGRLGPFLRLANRGLALPSAVAIDSGGRATILMSAFTPNGGESIVYLQQVEPNGRLRRPLTVASTVGRAFALAAAAVVDRADDDVVLTWTTVPLDGNTCCARAWTRTLSASGRLGPAVAVSPPDIDADGSFDGGEPSVAVAPNGLRTFVWTSEKQPLDASPVAVVQARTMTAQGEMGPVRTISQRYVLQGVLPNGSLTSSGVSFAQLSVVALADDRAIVDWTIETRRSAVMDERSVSPTGAGPVRAVVTGAYTAPTGELIAGTHDALAIWSTETSTRAFKSGIQLRDLSSTGGISPVQTALGLNRIDADLPVLVAAAMNPQGRVVAITNTEHGLVILARPSP
jgi:hypothetical protein